MIGGVALAQMPSGAPSSNLRQKAIAIKADSLLLDSLSIVPNTLQLQNIPDSLYRLDFVRSILYWKHRPSQDSVHLQYRVFPYRLNSLVQRLDYDSVKNNIAFAPFEFNNNPSSASGNGLFNFGNLQANGSISRGMSFGNAQDAVVNSNFNLQLNGMLADSIELTAAISDNNIPIQPDGTTKQLNEFDQVFLQFKKKNWQLNLGDIDLRQNSLYFLNFYKRLQGVSFQTTNYIGKHVQSSTLVSGSIAKGKFTRNIIQGLEGNQGPYRLTGANNEFFFIVLPNTERVFLDGVLLQRGEDQDYIINYNTAEVSFTPRRMITKDARIQIEFEYADRNYLNANLYAYQTVTTGKLQVRLGAFQNNDARNTQLNQTLDDQQKRFLSQIGDSVNKAFYPTVSLDSFSRDRILYERVYYTNSSGALDSFYRYSTDSLAAHYSVAFTDLGQGGGNYVQDLAVHTNGKVYLFIAPINGVKQGRFEPVMKLVTPKKQQLISVATDYQFDKNNALKTEFSLSKYDVNTFSLKDKNDDGGVAARVQYQNTSVLNKASVLQLVSNIDFEHVQKQFHPLERLRYVEFSREWGLPQVLEAADEDILRFSTQLQGKSNSVNYQFMTYQRSDDYHGVQNILQQNTTLGGWTFANQLALTNFTNAQTKGAFFRPVIDVSKQLKQFHFLKVGARYALEKNEVKDKQTDSTTNSSFSFDTYSAYIKTDESKKNRYALTFFTRADKYPFDKTLAKGDRSYNINLQAQLTKSEHHQLLFNTTFRQLDVLNDKITTQKKDRTILGRVEYQINEFKNFITGNTLYEVGAGQEQKRDLAYYEVPAGKGEYTWIDYNNDGIQQLNEFEIALFPDQAKFLRIFIPTNEFTKANYTTLNYSFTFTPKQLYSGDKASKAFLTRFVWQTAMQRNRKGIAKGDFELNPFKYGIQDTALISLTTSLNNTLSFNRFSSKWGIDLSNLQNRGKSLLTYGYESRQRNDWLLRTRWNLSPAFTLNLNGRDGLNSLLTPSFDNRNYEIKIYSAEPQVVFIHRSVFRLQTGYKFDVRHNKAEFGGENSTLQSIDIQGKYSVLQNASINTTFTLSNIHYPYPANTTVSYIMLEGLLPGSNYQWSLDFTKRLFGFLEWNLQYEGRKAGQSKTVHIGRASIRALF